MLMACAPILMLPGWAREYLPCPVPLLTLAPPLGRLMRPPGAVHAIAELHLYATLVAPAFWACLLAFSGSSSAGKRWSNASSRASRRCSSLLRKVTCTLRPARVTWTFALAGASGSARTGSPGGRAEIGWGSVWPFWGTVVASSLDLANGYARLARPAAIRCLHQ